MVYADKKICISFCFFFLSPQWFISQQVPQFEDVKFEAASILSELFCQQVSYSFLVIFKVVDAIVVVVAASS